MEFSRFRQLTFKMISNLSSIWLTTCSSATNITNKSGQQRRAVVVIWSFCWMKKYRNICTKLHSFSSSVWFSCSKISFLIWHAECSSNMCSLMKSSHIVSYTTCVKTMCLKAVFWCVFITMCNRELQSPLQFRYFL